MENSRMTFFRESPETWDALDTARPKTRSSSLPVPVPDHRMEEFILENPLLKEIKARQQSFNIFVSLNAADYETKHSNFLRWLIDPQEPHGRGAEFLRSMLNALASRAGATGHAAFPLADELSKADFRRVTIET